MNQAELCGRCGKTTVFALEDGQPTCPDCGWSRAAGARYAQEVAAKATKAKLLRVLYGVGIALVLLAMMVSPRLREAGERGAIKGTLFFLVGIAVVGLLALIRR
jgi:ribosomal protein L37E